MRIGNNMREEIKNVRAVDQKHEYDEHWPKSSLATAWLLPTSPQHDDTGPNSYSLEYKLFLGTKLVPRESLDSAYAAS